MQQVLDAMDIYERGLRDLSSLKGRERLVFMLQDFDNLMEMEGWEHFFLYECHFAWYSEMKEWLSTIGDRASLAVLGEFETHLQGRGVPLSPSAFESFLNSGGDAYLRAYPDWRSKYCELRGTRWARASAYLESQDQTLNTAGPGAAPDSGGS